MCAVVAVVCLCLCLTAGTGILLAAVSCDIKGVGWRAVCVARVGDKINVCRVSVGNPEGKKHLQDLDLDGWIILIWITSIKITDFNKILFVM